MSVNAFNDRTALSATPAKIVVGGHLSAITAAEILSYRFWQSAARKQRRQPIRSDYLNRRKRLHLCVIDCRDGFAKLPKWGKVVQMLRLAASKEFTGLTPADLHLFERVAGHMVAARKWVQVKHRRQNDFDFFDISRCGASGIEFSIGRRVDGIYILIDHRTGTTWTAESLGKPLRELVCHSAEAVW